MSDPIFIRYIRKNRIDITIGNSSTLLNKFKKMIYHIHVTHTYRVSLLKKYIKLKDIPLSGQKGQFLNRTWLKRPTCTPLYTYGIQDYICIVEKVVFISI